MEIRFPTKTPYGKLTKDETITTRGLQAKRLRRSASHIEPVKLNN